MYRKRRETRRAIAEIVGSGVTGRGRSETTNAQGTHERDESAANESNTARGRVFGDWGGAMSVGGHGAGGWGGGVDDTAPCTDAADERFTSDRDGAADGGRERATERGERAGGGGPPNGERYRGLRTQNE